jgi:hypothetical protein
MMGERELPTVRPFFCWTNLSSVNIFSIIWCINLLLGNDSKLSNYTTTPSSVNNGGFYVVFAIVTHNNRRAVERCVIVMELVHNDL